MSDGFSSILHMPNGTPGVKYVELVGKSSSGSFSGVWCTLGDSEPGTVQGGWLQMTSISIGEERGHMRWTVQCVSEAAGFLECVEREPPMKTAAGCPTSSL